MKTEKDNEVIIKYGREQVKGKSFVEAAGKMWLYLKKEGLL